MYQVICKLPAEKFIAEFDAEALKGARVMGYFERRNEPFVQVTIDFEYEYQAKQWACPFEGIAPEIVSDFSELRKVVVIGSCNQFIQTSELAFRKFAEDLNRSWLNKDKPVPYWVHLQQTKKPMGGKR